MERQFVRLLTNQCNGIDRFMNPGGGLATGLALNSGPEKSPIVHSAKRDVFWGISQMGEKSLGSGDYTDGQ